MGPITVFDKSFLQTISVDESVWFDHFFYPVITPVFLVETLGDLAKTPREGKTPEGEVGIIAARTPEMSGAPCRFHHSMCIDDLMGHHVPLDGRIPVAGMQRVVRDGQVGAILEPTPEALAFARWQRRDFNGVERKHAQGWRALLARVDLSAIERSMKRFGISARTCKTLEAALLIADEALLGLSKSPGRFDAVLEVLEVPYGFRQLVKQRWRKRGNPKIAAFAPYAAHILRVELFFRVGLGANLIASTRASHRVDMTYLFYLPFCSLFVSTDKLHRQCVPLFLRSDQEFVWGTDLKEDLAALNSHFSTLPAEVKKRGIYKFANTLPNESRGLIRDLFERHMPESLAGLPGVNSGTTDSLAHQELVQRFEEWRGAPRVSPMTPAVNEDDVQTLVLERMVSRTRGSWVQVPPDVND